MKDAVIRAFRRIRKGNSADAVIADPAFNRRLIRRCRLMGIRAHAREINRTLLNARKTGDLKGIRSKRVVVRNQESYRFASEAAVRFLERRDKTTLDSILCDPVSANEFDEIARKISPGFTAFEYRWAAFGLRKRRSLKPELVGKVIENVQVVRYKVDELKIELLPRGAGVYLFHDANEALYAGEAKNIYRRVKKHLEHSDRKGLAHWLWQHGTGEMHVELHVLSDDVSSVARRALEIELIRSRRPRFNISGADG
jgi:GIY-YIG catalytic domain